MAELLIYGSIDAFSTTEFIKEFNEAAEDSGDITVRVNTPGGSPEYGFGLVSKFAEFQGNKKVKVDGKAYSMGLFFLCYTDNTEALDVSEFLLHRAAYSEWIENSKEYFTDAMRENLARINANLRKAFENKVDVKLFEELTGCKLKDVFSMDSRIDVFFSADVAKKVGLISKINKITPQKKAEIDSRMYEIAAMHTGIKPAANTEQITKSNDIKMTIEKLKAEYPDICAQIAADAVAQERDRVEACLVYLEIDAKAVKEAIESGKPLSQKQMADLSLKAVTAKQLGSLEAEAAAAVTTAEEPLKEQPAATAEEKEMEAFRAQVSNQLKIK